MSARLGAASDIYAVGAVGFFLLTGEPVFTGKTLAELCAHHIHTEPRAPSTVATHEIPKALDDVVLRCLAKRPAARPASAGAVRDALNAIALGPWQDGEDWWDAFDASRDDTAPPVDTPKELTVDLRAREA